jgi:hypothetical protein
LKSHLRVGSITRISLSQALCVIQKFPSSADDLGRGQLGRAAQGEDPMHDLMIALAFIGMVVAPAVVAAKPDTETADETE